MTYARKVNLALEERLREHERINNAPTLVQQFPKLKSLSAVLGYFDTGRNTPAGELRYRANVQHARAILTFNCPNATCRGGGFDLSSVLATAVTQKRRSAQGEMQCQGTRTIAKLQKPCQHVLQYKLTLAYA